MRYSALGTLAVLVSATTAQAIITHGDDLDKPKEAFVGLFRGGSAVAIGEHHFITAAHVGGVVRSAVVMDGERYLATNIITHPTADFAIIEVSESLPGWHEVTTDIQRGDRVILGGFGRIDERRTRKGYTWSSERAEVWGENKVNFFRRGLGFFDFDKKRKRKLESEAIFTPGDSGGGVFVVAEDGSLQLAGIAVGVTGKRGLSRFGNLGVFLAFNGRADFFAQATDGVLSFATVPSPGSAVLLVGASAVVSMRRRRNQF